MREQLLEYLSGPALLWALERDLRQLDDDPERRRQLLQRLSATVLTRPAALVTACRASRLHERSLMLAQTICRHALEHACGETERSLVLTYGAEIGLEFSGVKQKSTPPAPARYLTAAQQRALKRLHAMARVFLDGPRSGTIAPRLIPLIVGPTGVGKNHLVRLFAQEVGCPVLRLTVGDWIVQGARRQGTLERMRDFIGPHPRAILHLDELDKFRLHNDPWSLAIFGELFAILDRDVAVSTEDKPWTPEHTEKLRRSVFIVGSGTWQDAWGVPQCDGVFTGKFRHGR